MGNITAPIPTFYTVYDFDSHITAHIKVCSLEIVAETQQGAFNDPPETENPKS